MISSEAGPKVVLFDFDGTIAATIEAGVEIFNTIAREHGFVEITKENIPALRAKGAREAAHELHIPSLMLPIVVNKIRNGIKSRIPELAIVSGIKEAIVSLKKNGWELGIVTSNSKENILAFLKHNDFEIFDYINAGSSIFYKASAIRKIISENNLSDRKIVFVGDEIRDVIAAKKNNITAIGVTWGINSRAGFEKENADFIVDTVEELTKILSDFCEVGA